MERRHHRRHERVPCKWGGTYCPTNRVNPFRSRSRSTRTILREWHVARKEKLALHDGPDPRKPLQRRASGIAAHKERLLALHDGPDPHEPLRCRAQHDVPSGAAPQLNLHAGPHPFLPMPCPPDHFVVALRGGPLDMPLPPPAPASLLMPKAKPPQQNEKYMEEIRKCALDHMRKHQLEEYTEKLKDMSPPFEFGN